MKRSKLTVLLTLAVALFLTMDSCKRKTVYHHYEHTSTSGWEKNDTLCFTVGPTGRSTTFHEEIGLRINGFYPFMSLCLVIDQATIPGHLMRRDTLNCSLIDNRGNVKGQGISYFQYQFHLTDITLSATDTLLVYVRHNMKREILPGIADVGLMLKER